MAPEITVAAVLSLLLTLCGLRVVSSASCDARGIVKIYADSAIAPHNWEDNWLSNSRSMSSVSTDPKDANATFRGTGRIRVEGSTGIMSMSNSPRYYVGDEMGNLKWQNVEMTVYARRVLDSSIKPHTGFTLVARTNHDLYKEDPCQALGYHARIHFETGEAAFQKEFYHGSSVIYSASKRTSKVPWGSTVQKSVWIGIKFIVRTLASDDVELEMWIDMTDGVDGGKWSKIWSFTDSGTNWRSTKRVPPECSFGDEAKILRPGNVVFLRTDSVEQLDWKLFSVREIDVDAHAPLKALAQMVLYVVSIQPDG